MFADQFLPNLSLFVVGQAAAWFYLRTGRLWIGAAATAALWVFLDWLLLARYVFGATSGDLRLPLFLLQTVALWTLLALSWAQWRRRWSATARARPALFALAMAQYLRADHAAAAATWRRLTWADPWDAAAWTGLGNALARSDQSRRAFACYRRAEGVDTGRRLADFLQHQRTLLRRRHATPREAQPPVVAAPAVPAPRPAP